MLITQEMWIELNHRVRALEQAGEISTILAILKDIRQKVNHLGPDQKAIDHLTTDVKHRTQALADVILKSSKGANTEND